MLLPRKPDHTKLSGCKQDLLDEQAEYDKFMKLPEAERIAEHAHDILCHGNHVDYCGWFYSSDWTDSTKARYLKAAKKLIASGVTYEQVSNVFETFRGV